MVQHLFCEGWWLNRSDVVCSMGTHTHFCDDHKTVMPCVQKNSRSPFREQLPQSKLSWVTPEPGFTWPQAP